MPSITPRKTDCRAVFTFRVLVQLKNGVGGSSLLRCLPRKAGCRAVFTFRVLAQLTDGVGFVPRRTDSSARTKED